MAITKQPQQANEPKHANEHLDNHEYSPFSPLRTYLSSVFLGLSTGLFIPKPYQCEIVSTQEYPRLFQSLYQITNGYSLHVRPIHLLGLTIVGLGALLKLSSYIALLDKKTWTNPLGNGRVSALVTGGIYQYMRNPIYLASLIMQGGLSLSMNSWWPILCLVPWWSSLLMIVIPGEEQLLERLFAQQYVQYKKETKRWFFF